MSGGLNQVPRVGELLSQSSDVISELLGYGHRDLVCNTELAKLFGQLQAQGDTILIADHFHKAQFHHTTQLGNVIAAAPSLRVLLAQNTQNFELVQQISSDAMAPYLHFLERFPDPDEHLARATLDQLEKCHGAILSNIKLPDIGQGIRSFLNEVYAKLAMPQEQRDLGEIEKKIICVLGVTKTSLSQPAVFNCRSTAALIVPDSAGSVVV
ncbi:MAG: hypothetical protein ABJL72_22330 [Roseobacter sp.]